MQTGREKAVDAVGQATLFTYLGGQPRHKTAAAQGVVTHSERKKIRVRALVAGLTDQDMRLGRIKSKRAVHRRAEWLDFSHSRQSLAARCITLGQSGQQRSDQRIGLSPRDIADHADFGSAGLDMLGIKLLHVCCRDARQRRWRCLQAIRVGTVDGCAKSLGGHSRRSGVRLTNGSADAFALLLPDRIGPGRLTDLAGGQGHRLRQQVRIAQAAHCKSQAVTAGADGKNRPQISPGFAELVFIQRHSAGACSQALAAHARHGTGQANFVSRVATAAGVKVNLNVQHGNAVALDQVDLGTAGLGPVLYGQSSPCHQAVREQGQAKTQAG